MEEYNVPTFNSGLEAMMTSAIRFQMPVWPSGACMPEVHGLRRWPIGRDSTRKAIAARV